MDLIKQKRRVGSGVILFGLCLLLLARPVFALNLEDPRVIWDVTGRLLSGQPTSLEEQLGVAAPQLNTPVSSDGTGYILIGDSRITALNATCQINATPDNWFVVACAGVHLNYLSDIAIPVGEMIEAAHPEITRWKYIINLGLTDLDRPKAYKDYLSQLSQTKEVYFASVGPTSSTKTTKTFALTNQRIEKFNAQMAGLPTVRYIDLWSYLGAFGYTNAEDGFHYDSATSKRIYQFLREAMRQQMF
ncbi:MAG: SGNH/GDSL hydrolase family protein [Lachnospiraceae bacterium]|nr:SGNH/GDSL hydrolase family protein [Lachnospiraceae bacterium]